MSRLGRARRHPRTFSRELVTNSVYDLPRVESRMWVVHFTDKNGKATVAVCQSRDAALKSARGLRQHFCAVHYISGPNGARIELKDILEWCSQQARNVG
jgi:hypothetical protein